MRQRFQVVAAAVMIAAALTGCGKKNINVPELTADDAARMTSIGNFPHTTYRIEPGDTVQVRYVFHPEMKQEDVVRPDGKITLALVGELVVAGMAPGDLERYLAKATAGELRNPEVVVSISKFSDKNVFVGGEVGRPGTLPYRKDLTPLQAIIAAGGFRDTAAVDSIILVRAGVNNQIMSRKINLEEVVNNGNPEPLALAPHDIIFVPRSAIADANLWVRQHITDLIPIFRGVGASVPLGGL
jgi:protein involved in polysaccharide export with SLBB domain